MPTETVGTRVHHPGMHHPWRWLRDQFADWTVYDDPTIPIGLLGQTDSDRRRILLRPGLLQCQRRTVIDHELRHARDGDVGEQHPKREAQINRESARALVPFAQMLEAWLWAFSVEELADECWVDVQTMRRRIDCMTIAERETVRAALAERDYHEEGL